MYKLGGSWYKHLQNFNGTDLPNMRFFAIGIRIILIKTQTHEKDTNIWR